MPPHKAVEPPKPVAPGPIHLEVRINGKIAFLQRVHSYTIDQQQDQAVITGVLRLPVEDNDDDNQ
jgi:hypothetical protein